MRIGSECEREAIRSKVPALGGLWEFVFADSGAVQPLGESLSRLLAPCYYY